MLPEAYGLGQHFQARGHSFSLYGPTLSRPITFLSFYSCRKLAHKWVCKRKFAIESAYAPSTIQTISKTSNKRTNENEKRCIKRMKRLNENEERCIKEQIYLELL